MRLFVWNARMDWVATIGKLGDGWTIGRVFGWSPFSQLVQFISEYFSHKNIHKALQM